MKKQFYTYIHLNPETFEIFYVGKGIANRAYSKTKRNTEWKKYIESLQIDFKVLIVSDNQSSEEAEELEQMLITKIGSVIEGGTLLNRDGLGFNPNMLISIGEEEKKNEKPKYFSWSDNDIISDLLSFPNFKSGELAEKRLEEIAEGFNKVYDDIEEYSEDMLFDLEQFYDDLESLISEHKHSSNSKKEFVEELKSIEEDIEEFREENEEKINEIIEKALWPIEKEIKKLKKENYS